MNAQLQQNSRWNKDYIDLNEAEASTDRAIERLERVTQRNPENTVAREALEQMRASRARFVGVLQALLE